MKRYICRAVIDGVKQSFPILAYSFDSAVSQAYFYVNEYKHGRILSVKSA